MTFASADKGARQRAAPSLPPPRGRRHKASGRCKPPHIPRVAGRPHRIATFQRPAPRNPRSLHCALGCVQLPKDLPLLMAPRHVALFGLLLSAVLRGALVEQLRVRLHKQLQDVERQTMDRAVPMLLRVLVQGGDDDGEQVPAVLVDELHDVVIVPEEECALGNLEVRARDAESEAAEEHVLHAVELGRLRQLERLLELVQEEHLFGGDRHRPIPKHGRDDVVRQTRVLLDVLGHAVRELLVEACERLHLVQRDQRLDQKVLVLVLERQGEAVDDGAQDLEQLTDAVLGLAFVDDLEEDVLDRATDKGPQRHELAVDAVEDRFQVVALARVLGVEQLQKLEHEVLVHEALCDLRVDIVGHDEAEEELIHDLQVGPCALEAGLLLLGIREGERVLVPRLQGAEDVRAYHIYDILHQSLVEAIAGIVDILDDLQQCLPLRFFLALVGIVVEVENR
mmetsp:Transcript_118593/g.342948  ORF Transcript_118593/g.342948 Transcript_118593/m.342948 type:complete len:453 (+) Transcript_118593:216-1574(+)